MYTFIGLVSWLECILRFSFMTAFCNCEWKRLRVCVVVLSFISLVREFHIVNGSITRPVFIETNVVVTGGILFIVGSILSADNSRNQFNDSLEAIKADHK